MMGGFAKDYDYGRARNKVGQKERSWLDGK